MEMQRKRQDHFPGMSGIDSYWSLTNIFYEFPLDLIIIITSGDQTHYNLSYSDYVS